MESSEGTAVLHPERFRDLPTRRAIGSGLAIRAGSGIRVDAATHRKAQGRSERVVDAKLRPAAVTMARESKVARDMPRRSSWRSLRQNSSGLSPARCIWAARVALCKAIDMPSPVNDGMTAA